MKNRKNFSIGIVWIITILASCSMAQSQPNTACLCAQWSPNTVTFVDGSTGQSQTLACGSTTTITDISIFSFTPNFACSRPATGTATPFGYNFVTPGLYTVIITPACGGVNCPTCTIKVALKPCKCGAWDLVPVTITGGPKVLAPINPNVKCNTSKVIKPGSYTLTGYYKCAPPSCTSGYSWSWTGPGSTSGSSSGVNFTHLFALGMYHVTVVPICGGNKCSACDFYLSVQP